MPKVKTETPPADTTVVKFAVTIRTLTDMLGTAPADPDLYSDFIVSKALTAHQYKALTKEDRERVRKAINDHELSMLPGASNAGALDDAPQSVKDVLALATTDTETKGKTVYRRNGTGLIMLDYQIKGFCKAAGKAISNIYQPESRIDKWVHLGPREIPIMRAGAQIAEAEGESVRPLRIEDKMTGVSRTAIAVSEIVKPGAEMSFEVLVLPKGFLGKSTGGQFKVEEIKQWFEFGLFSGLGSWRNSSHGAFDLLAWEQVPLTWAESLDIRRKQLTTTFGEELAQAIA